MNKDDKNTIMILFDEVLNKYYDGQEVINDEFCCSREERAKAKTEVQNYIENMKNHLRSLLK